MELRIQGLKKSFGKKQVLCGIDFNFEKGKIYGLLGKNGAGKTTLFNCLSEDISCDEGSFSVIKDDGMQGVSDEEIAYVLSTPIVPDFLTGREFLKFYIDIHKEKIKDLKDIDSYFDLVRIDVEDRDKLMRDYSHGMKNKMQMLIGIISNSSVLLLDEPLTSFDVLVAEEMKELLIELKENRIIIFSTHIMDLAISLCDEILILHEGVLTPINKTGLTGEDLKLKVIELLRGGEINDQNILNSL